MQAITCLTFEPSALNAQAMLRRAIYKLFATNSKPRAERFGARLGDFSGLELCGLPNVINHAAWRALQDTPEPIQIFVFVNAYVPCTISLLKSNQLKYTCLARRHQRNKQIALAGLKTLKDAAKIPRMLHLDDDIRCQVQKLLGECTQTVVLQQAEVAKRLLVFYAEWFAPALCHNDSSGIMRQKVHEMLGLACQDPSLTTNIRLKRCIIAEQDLCADTILAMYKSSTAQAEQAAQAAQADQAAQAEQAATSQTQQAFSCLHFLQRNQHHAPNHILQGLCLLMFCFVAWVFKANV